METSVHGITAPSAVYEVRGRRFEITAPGFAEAIVDAYASHVRPRCMCLVEGLEMYVARLGDGYIVKRMPDTGSHHAPDCSSYEPPAEFSGLGQLLSSAITEDPTTGETTLKLGFPLSKMSGRPTMPTSGAECDSVATDGTKLSLRPHQAGIGEIVEGLVAAATDVEDQADPESAGAAGRSVASTMEHAETDDDRREQREDHDPPAARVHDRYSNRE